MACSPSIPYGHWFKYQLLHFLTSSLVLHLGKKPKMAQVPGPLPTTWKTWKKFLTSGFGLVQHWLLWQFGEWTNWRKMSLPFSCSLSPLLLLLCDSTLQINISFKSILTYIKNWELYTQSWTKRVESSSHINLRYKRISNILEETQHIRLYAWL